MAARRRAQVPVLVGTKAHPLENSKSCRDIVSASLTPAFSLHLRDAFWGPGPMGSASTFLRSDDAESRFPRVRAHSIVCTCADGASGSPREERALSSGARGGKSCASAQVLYPAQLRFVTFDRRGPGTGGSPHLRALTCESTHTPPSRDKRRHSWAGRAAALLSVFTPPVPSLKPEACSQSLGQRRREGEPRVPASPAPEPTSAVPFLPGCPSTPHQRQHFQGRTGEAKVIFNDDNNTDI